jgi:hypothetical protein
VREGANFGLRPAMRIADMVIVQNWHEELKEKVRPK